MEKKKTTGDDLSDTQLEKVLAEARDGTYLRQNLMCRLRSVNRTFRRVVDECLVTRLTVDGIPGTTTAAAEHHEAAVRRHFRRWANVTDLVWVHRESSTPSSMLAQSMTMLTALRSLTLRDDPHAATIPLRGQHLTELNFEHCGGLVSCSAGDLPETVQHLGFSGCGSLESALPRDFGVGVGALRNLRRLELDGCASLTTLGPLELCPALQELYVNECPVLSDLAPVWRALGTLRHVNLTAVGWGAVASAAAAEAAAPLPYTDASALEDMYMCITAQTLPPDLRRCERLRRLQYVDPQALFPAGAAVALPALPQRLEAVRVSMVPALASLEPLLASRLSLRYLDLTGCARLPSLEPLARCAALQTLLMQSCPSVASLEPLARCASLENLDIAGCGGMRSLEPLAACRSLRRVTASGCRNLTELAHCPGLRELMLDRCESLASLEPLAGCRELSTLVLAGCTALTGLGPLEGLAGEGEGEGGSLRFLDVRGCTSHVGGESPPAALARCIEAALRVPNFEFISDIDHPFDDVESQ